MTNADMMVVFDAIMTILGVYIVFSTRCKDVEGFIAYLFPKGMGIGLIGTGFGIVGICNDAFANLGQIVNVIALVIFIAAWVWFSVQFRKGKEKFF